MQKQAKKTTKNAFLILLTASRASRSIHVPQHASKRENEVNLKSKTKIENKKAIK
jgi:hypothetical protein